MSRRFSRLPMLVNNGWNHAECIAYALSFLALEHEQGVAALFDEDQLA